MKRSKAGLAALTIAGASIFLTLGGANAQSPDLPDGPGKATVQQNCTVCHGAELITARRRSVGEWEAVVNRMVSNGAALTDDQYHEVVAYLKTYLGEASGSGVAPASANVPSRTGPSTR